MMRKNAFTLVELLVVTVVVVLVISLPKARENARNVLCKTNLKGYGNAFMMYLDDNDQRFPDAGRWLFGEDRGDTGKYCRWHNESLNLRHYPEDGGVFWRYVADRNNHLCPTFDRLAVGGLGARHARHEASIPIEPQYNYSMNGYLGAGRFGVIEKLGQIEQNPARIFSFTEENVMWDIQQRSTFRPEIGSNQIVARLKPYAPEDYNGAFATYHSAPKEDIELRLIDDISYATQKGKEYPEWGLCRGTGNAVFLDQHVEAMPYYVDTHEYAWPLRNSTVRPWTLK